MIARLTSSSTSSRIPDRLVELGVCLPMLAFFYWPTSWPRTPALLLLLVVAVLAWLRLEIAVALIPLTLPYYLLLQPLRTSGSPAFSLGELGLFICVGVAILRSVLLAAERRATLEWARGLWQQARPFVLPALLLLVGASLGVLVAPDRHVSLRAYREDIIEPLAYLLLVLRYLRTRTDLVRAVVALVVAALMVSSAGVYQGTIDRKWHYVNATTVRVAGPYGSPNNLGFFLERALPVLFALALTHLLRRPAGAATRAQPIWRNPLRWACLLACLPLLAALYLTESRGAELGVVVAALFLFVVEVRRWLAVGALVVVGAIGAFVFRTRLPALFEQGHVGTISERFLYWKAALLMIRDHPIFGIGPDSFGRLYSPYLPSTSKHPNPDSYALKALNGQPFPATYDPGISHPHNFILDFWLSSGLLGLAALVWLLGAFAAVWLRVYRLCAPLRRGDLLQRLLLGVAASMLAAFVHGLVDNSYFLPDLSMVFWLFIGLLLVIRGLAERESREIIPEQGAQTKEIPTQSAIQPA